MPESGENILCIEVYQAGVMNYYLPLEKAYFSANLTIVERVYNTTDFECFHLSDRVQNCQRYCGQRTFIEDYVASCCRTDFYSGKNTYQKVETVFVKADKSINKDCEYPTLKEFDKVKLIEYGRVLEGKKKRYQKIKYLFMITLMNMVQQTSVCWLIQSRVHTMLKKETGRLLITPIKWP